RTERTEMREVAGVRREERVAQRASTELRVRRRQRLLHVAALRAGDLGGYRASERVAVRVKAARHEADAHVALSHRVGSEDRLARDHSDEEPGDVIRAG